MMIRRPWPEPVGIRRAWRGRAAIVFAAVALAGVGTTALPQSGHPRIGSNDGTADSLGNPPFHTGVDLVALHVSVTGHDGRHVSGLSPRDFRILDNNRLQQLSVFLPGGRVPLAAVLLIDCSASMKDPKLDRAKNAAGAFLRALHPEDLVELIAFNESAERPLPLAGDHAAVERALGGLAAGGQTALYDAMVVATHDLQRARRHLAPEYRLAIVLLSDGDDNASRLSFDDALEETRRSDVVVYPVSLRFDDKGHWLAAPFELAQLAFESGGRAIPVRDANALPAVYAEIRTDLQSLYTVGYVPDRAVHDGRWHAVTVRVSDPGAVVRTRPGYYAATPLAGSGRD